MKSILFLNILFVLSFLNGCTYNSTSSDCDNPDYSGCDTYQPDSSEVQVLCSVDIDNLEVPITIYKGKISDSIEILRDTISTPQNSYYLPVNQFYSVKAVYTTPKGKVIAIDGEKLKLSSYALCDSICWEVNMPVVNLKLRKDLR